MISEIQSRKQALFYEIDKHLLYDDKPSGFFKKLMENDLFKNEYPFTLISRLEKTEQSPTHHPEGSVWNHTLLVLDNAARVKTFSRESRVFMWSALLHDLGKATTTKLRKGRITSYNHDIEGEKLAVSLLEYFNEDKIFTEKVARMVRWHMQILFVTKNLPFSNIEKMKEEVDIEEIALLGLCDRLGRGMEQDVENEIKVMENFINVCRNN
ncbi:MAG: HD domain-containing protein [Clostridiaceae bacterium]|nr:HD domain-containing protein [Clostridiaceae bacterium]